MRKKTYEAPLIEECELETQAPVLETSTIGTEDYNTPGGGWNWGN